MANLYRLDSVQSDGSLIAVSDFFGPVLEPQAARAKHRALNAAEELGLSVLVTRIQGAGRMTKMYHAHPDGTITLNRKELSNVV